jgi:hypothetical protein
MIYSPFIFSVIIFYMGFVPSIQIAFVMLFINMICWGSWTNPLKKCGNWRFEGFYWDYAWSIVVWSFLLSVAFGGFTPTGWSPFLFIEGLLTSPPWEFSG